VAVAIIQARMGSSRLPGKVLADLHGVPALRLMLGRVGAARSIDQVVVACPDLPLDDVLADAVRSWRHAVYRGPADDVLTRVLGAAHSVEADVVVRLTADCPLADPAVIDQVLGAFAADPRCDYLRVGPGFPEGLDAEVVRVRALDELAALGPTPVEREHVTLGIRGRPERFSCQLIDHEPDLGRIRMTIDEEEDLRVVRELVRRLGGGPEVGWRSYADVLARDRRLAAVNTHVPRNEGLWRSHCLDALAEVRPSTDRRESLAWLARANAVIPHATQTMSKAIDQFVEGVTPAFLSRGLGCEVWDVDGNAYIDYPMALGPILLGYGHPAVESAVRVQLDQGPTFTLPHPIETEVAELVCATVPSAEMVRFAKNGSDVTSAAVRLARAVTGRDRVLASGYHGWHDWYVGLTELRRGVPKAVVELTDRLPTTKLEDAERVVEDGAAPAAIVLEVGPEGLDPGVVRGLRQLCDELGTVMIWDEIVTGFRWAPGGAQELYGVKPDLTCLGKAMGNGYPLAALAGRAELMQELRSVFFSGTFGGETVSLAAALATITVVRSTGVCDHVWSHGERLRSGLRKLIDASGLEVELLGEAPRSTLTFRVGGQDAPALRGLFLQETSRRGVLFGGPIFISLAHTEQHIDRTLDVCTEAFDVLVDAVATDSVTARLAGPPPGVVFKPVR
jgi:glutamate-1-semialdehyde 2,1-aminomutase/spore coat polysaccharide biosynthesis protein SpsF